MTDSWGFGAEGEQLVYDLLRCDGWHLINTAAAMTGGAPMLAGPHDLRILPDLFGFKDGAAFFEVKTKSKARRFYKEDELRHGFERRNYEHYLDVTSATGVPVHIIIYEQDSQTVLRADLASLSIVDETSADQCEEYYDGEGVVFFRRDEFTDRVDATRFDGESYVRGTPVSDLRQPVFESQLSAWDTGGVVSASGGGADD